MSESSRNFYGACVASAITFAVLYPFAYLSIDFDHDGIMLKPALDVWSGQALHRDTFTQYGPLTTWLHAAALSLHPSLLSLRLFTVVAYGLSAFFLFLSWAQISNRIIAASGILLFLVMAPYFDQRWIMIPWSSAAALMFQSAAIYALCKVIDDRHARFWPVVLGANAALAFWARPLLVGVGLLAALALVAILFLLRRADSFGPSRSQWSVAVLTFAVINICFLVALFATGALSAWLEQNWLWPLRGYVGGTVTHILGESSAKLLFRELSPKSGIKIVLLFVASCLPFWAYRLCKYRRNPFSIGAFLIAVAVCATGLVYAVSNLQIFMFPEGWGGRAGGLAPFFCIVLATGALATILVFLFRPDGGGLRTKKILALAVISVASLTQFHPTYSLPQIWWSLAPACGLIAAFVWVMFRHQTKVTVLVLGLLLLPSIAQKVRLAKANLSEPRVTLTHPSTLSGLRVSPEMAQVIDSINDAVALHVVGAEAKAIVLLEDMPLFSCFSDNLANPTPYFVNWPGLMSAETLEQRDDWIKENQPVVVLATPHKSIDLSLVDAFCAKNKYRVQLVVPHQPTQWWWGGQAKADFVRGLDRQRATAAVLLPISQPDR